MNDPERPPNMDTDKTAIGRVTALSARPIGPDAFPRDNDRPMGTTAARLGNRFHSFLCSLFGHRYVVSKKVTRHIKEHRCAHCQKQMTTDVSGKLTPLTAQMREINATLEDMYKKRKKRGHPER